jgi:hypothetical protein
MAPAPVQPQAGIEIGPVVPAREAGSRNTPEPTMLPTTSAVAIHRPMVRLSFARALGAASSNDASIRTDIAILSTRERCSDPWWRAKPCHPRRTAGVVSETTEVRRRAVRRDVHAATPVRDDRHDDAA